ncbi:MAG: cytochrome C [Burkholderiaceae bacterium]
MRFHPWSGLLAGFLLLGSVSRDAQAIPLFAHQTGQPCASCHMGFPELTPFGRAFKLSGYTLGSRQKVPLSVMALGSATRIADDAGGAYAKSGKPVFEGGSVFTGGKITDHVGAFVQWTYDNLVDQGDGTFGGHGSIDNVDLRAAWPITTADLNLIAGLTLNNAPMVQDPFNSTPAWTYPYQVPKLASEGSGPLSTFIESQPRVAGLGAYTMIDDWFYAEVGGYRTADGALSILRAGTTPNPIADRVTLKGLNPYWRVAATKTIGDTHSLSAGAFGLDARQYPDYTRTDGPADRFRDLGFDLQYQFLGVGDWQASAHAYRIRERADWLATGSSHDNPVFRMTSTRASAQLVWRKRLQATIGMWRTSGDTDRAGLGTFSGRGNTSGQTYELAYSPIQNLRIGLQRTNYTSFAGLGANYDGAGRGAGANSTTYLYLWAAY